MRLLLLLVWTVAILTDRIKDLTSHVQQHKQDKMSMRSLVMLVHQRRRLMKYLLRESTGKLRALLRCLSRNVIHVYV